MRRFDHMLLLLTPPPLAATRVLSLPLDATLTSPTARFAACQAPVQRETDGVLKIHGCADGAGKPVLVVSNINEMCARLYELPTFESRGVLPQVSVRAWHRMCDSFILQLFQSMIS